MSAPTVQQCRHKQWAAARKNGGILKPCRQTTTMTTTSASSYRSAMRPVTPSATTRNRRIWSRIAVGSTEERTSWLRRENRTKPKKFQKRRKRSLVPATIYVRGRVLAPPRPLFHPQRSGRQRDLRTCSYRPRPPPAPGAPHTSGQRPQHLPGGRRGPRPPAEVADRDRVVWSDVSGCGRT